MALWTEARSKPSPPEKVTSEMTSKVAVTISSKASIARPLARAKRAEARSAAAVITGPRAAMLRWLNTGAAVRRCHSHSAPSATNIELPMAPSKISLVTIDFG